jgi:hypothetical protein
VSRVGRLLLERLDDHPLDVLIADRAGFPGTRLIMQPIDATPSEPAAPAPDRLGGAQPNRTAISLLGKPSAAASTIRQRKASA